MRLFYIFNLINLGDEESAIRVLTSIKNKKNGNYDVRILNSHITDLNIVIGKRVFKKDTLYVNYETLWEIMQPLGKKRKHNHHNLLPEEVYKALRTMKDSKDISVSYDDRYVIVTLATILDGANLTVIVSPKSSLKNDIKAEIIKVITIYPVKKKK